MGSRGFTDLVAGLCSLSEHREICTDDLDQRQDTWKSSVLTEDRLRKIAVKPSQAGCLEVKAPPPLSLTPQFPTPALELQESSLSHPAL